MKPTRSRRCLNECKPPFGFRGRPCRVCERRYEEWMDESYALYKLGRADIQSRQAVPATDQEWADHLDQVAPVVPTLTDLTFTHCT